METAKELKKRLETFISCEKYEEALEELQRCGIDFAEGFSCSSLHRNLLMLISRVYFHTRRFEKASEFISRIESLYPEILDDIEYIYIKSYLLHKHGKDERSLELLKDSINRDRPESELYRLRLYLGMAHFWCGNYIDANYNLQKCHRHYLSCGNSVMLGTSLYMLGYIALQRRFFDIAESYFQRAIENFTKAKKMSQLGSAHQMLGILNYRIGKYDESLEHSLSAEKLYKECNHVIEIISSSISRARVYMFLGDYTEAENLLLESYNDSLKLNYKRGVALSAEFMGEIYYHGRNYAESLRWLREAEKLSLRIAPRGDIAVEVYRRLGDVYIATGKLEEAEGCLAKAYDIAEHLGDKYELGTVLRAYGLVASERGDIDLARSFFDEAISTLKLIKESFELASTCLTAARRYRDWGAGKKERGDQQGETLLKEARASATEAMHLYSRIELRERARTCKELVRDIENISGKITRADSVKRVRFDPAWLHADFLVARSPRMRKLLTEVHSFARTDISVLINGETGTGKEVLAKYIHTVSERSEGPFVVINCASIAKSVFESELFGHRKGSFTGAESDRAGLIEKADGGTLFLDEISELSSEQQAKLLRVIEKKKLRRVGESTEKNIDVRILSATNEDVETLLESNRLRKDLYYRIAGRSITLEPLRRREKDIEALFSYYVNRCGEGFYMADGIISLLRSYHWPGNIRELVNLTRHLTSLREEDKVIYPHDLPADIINSDSEFPGGYPNRLKEIINNNSCLQDNTRELRKFLLRVLERNSGNKTAAARELGISRKTLYRYLDKLNLTGIQQ